MDPKIESRLDDILKITEENNKVLKKMRRAQRWANVMRVFYWLLIVGLALGSAYYIKPYLNQLVNIYSEGAEGFKTIKDFSGKIPSDLDILKELLGSEKQ